MLQNNPNNQERDTYCQARPTDVVPMPEKPLSKADIIMRKLFSAKPLPGHEVEAPTPKDGKAGMQEMADYQDFEDRALKRVIE